MHGQSPTSSMLTEPWGYARKSLSMNQKAATIRVGALAPSQHDGVQLGNPGLVVGGKDHGLDRMPELHVRWTSVIERSRNPLASSRNSSQVYFLPRVEGQESGGDHATRMSVGNSLLSVGVSPRTRQRIAREKG